MLPPSTNRYRTILTQNHHESTSSAPFWPSTITYQPVPPCSSTTKYKPVPLHTDPVPPSTNQWRLLLTQDHHISYPNVRLFFVDLRWAQLYVSLVDYIIGTPDNSDNPEKVVIILAPLRATRVGRPGSIKARKVTTLWKHLHHKLFLCFF